MLLVDDDITFCKLLAEYMASEGFHVESVHSGNAALARLREDTFDMTILDVMMPEKSGLDVLRELREFSNTPILMLTARGEEVDRIVGLEIGADDYVGKPCNPREIVARVRAILRRGEQETHAQQADVVVVGDVEMRLGERVVLRSGEVVDLTSTEYDVLAVLLRNAGHVVEKAKVAETVLRRKLGPYDRSIDMHVSRLRRKLGSLGDGLERIKTVRGVGYQYVRLEMRANPGR